MSATATYPVHVDATLDPPISRWLWLVKWLLAVPHFVILAFLWIAFVVVSVIAFFAILFTGRYPEGLFDFNVGVLRWSWRVNYYTYGALGTDRYPPFTLADVPDYPAHFDVDRPAHLSRGLVLVKWWLLAIPHYLVVGIFVGGGTWALWRTTDSNGGAPGLIGLLVLVAAVVLAFTGRYPEQIFDFVLGMNRWALRVAAYAGLMTDAYPPFRLDLGGHEDGGTVTVTPAEPAVPRRSGWTGGRVISLVVGSVLGLVALGLLVAGGVATWATNTQRDGAGFLTSDTRTFSTGAAALTSDTIDLGTPADRFTAGDLLGKARIRATSTASGKALFVGVAPQTAVDRYLGGVQHAVVTNWADGRSRLHAAAGSTVAASPLEASFWTARATGTGTQSLTWRPTGGHWVVVVMNADGSPNVSVTADVGAEVPDLGWVAAGLLVGGSVLLAGAVLLVVVPVVRASR